MKRRMSRVVLAVAGFGLLVSLGQPTSGRADGSPPLPTPTVDPKKGGPGGGS